MRHCDTSGYITYRVSIAEGTDAPTESVHVCTPAVTEVYHLIPEQNTASSKRGID